MVRGRVQYVGSVKGWSSSTYRRLAESLQGVDSTFKPRTLRTLEQRQAVRLLTEGASDYLHLLAAQRFFHANNEFLNLEMQADAESEAGGDSQLLDKCRGLALSPQPLPSVCVFDRDNDDIVRRAGIEGGPKEYGNGVVALAIAIPDWRDPGQACIEMLYGDTDLERRDENGRRIYLAEEFDARTGHHRSEEVGIPNPGRRPLVREDVYHRQTGDSLGLSKSSFAKLVYDQQPPFDQVDFEGFRKTFELIQKAVAQLSSGS